MLPSLPLDVACKIASEWLRLTDISRLDSAYCCHDGRSGFKALAYGPTTVQHHWVPYKSIVSNTKVAQWIVQRGVPLNNLVVDEWLLRSGIGLLNRILKRSGRLITVIAHPDSRYYNIDSTMERAMVCIAHNCPNLREVSMQRVSLTDQTLTVLVTSCPHLIRLEYKPHLSTRCISIISEGCLHLEHLVLCDRLHGGAKLDELTVQLAKSHPQLQSMMGTLFCGISEETLLTIISCCPSLQWLEKDLWSRISWPTIEVVVQKLQLRNFTVTDDNAVSAAQVTRVISHLVHLEEMMIFSNQFALEGCRQLAQCHILRKLMIYSSACNDACLEALAPGCTNLRELTVRNNWAVGGGALLALARHCSLLTDVDFSDTNVTDRGIIALAHGCPGLQRVILGDCENIMDNGVVALAQHCPYLTTLGLTHTNVGDAAVKALALHCRHLDFLDVQDCKSVTIVGLRALAANCPKSLRTLWAFVDPKQEWKIRRLFPRKVNVMLNGMEEADHKVRW